MLPPSLTIRPVLALRVGITGARTLHAAQEPRLRDQLRDVLADIAAVTDRLGALERSKGAFRGGRSLRFLSPLARGADRLAATAALAAGFDLHVPMPFTKAAYEADFKTAEDIAEFRTLLAQADSYICLDGDRDHDANRGYESVGRYVARNCDVLLAVWDGTPPDHRGGTADIVEYALTVGVPVVWLHATADIDPAWLAEMQDLRDQVERLRAPARPSKPAHPLSNALHTHLARLIHPPAPCRRHHHSALDRLAHAFHGHHVSPLAEYYVAPELPSRDVWRAHAWFMRTMAWQPPPQPPKLAPPPENPASACWYERYVHADHLAREYADRYRSGYVWTFLFATLSVAFGAIALDFEGASPAALPALFRPAGAAVWAQLFASLELFMILGVLLIVFVGIRSDWHEHSIEYRILAELCRKQQALGPLGWTLPITEISRLADPDNGDAHHPNQRPKAGDPDDPKRDRGAWVGWLFAAAQRAAPFPTGALDTHQKSELRDMILNDMIKEQIDYHAHRKATNGRAGRGLAWTGEIFFFAVLVIIAAKLWLEIHPATHHNPAWLGLAATVLPAISAAFVGIRAYAEVPLLEVQSHHTGAALNAARRRVRRLQMDRPFAAQDLGAEAADVATLMLQDLEGWARLFRVKALEAGG